VKLQLGDRYLATSKAFVVKDLTGPVKLEEDLTGPVKLEAGRRWVRHAGWPGIW
jgi:hypothetical protein